VLSHRSLASVKPLRRGHNPGKETCHGLALLKEYVNTDNYQDTYSGIIWRNLCDPCRNCNEMIWLHGGDTDNVSNWGGRKRDKTIRFKTVRISSWLTMER
jgi:hypothetical protein